MQSFGEEYTGIIQVDLLMLLNYEMVSQGPVQVVNRILLNRGNVLFRL
jgi:hypothetical protein